MNNAIKVTMIGAKMTGKTTLVSRMHSGTFNFQTSCTIGVSFSKLKHNDITYEIWDTAGQERFLALLPMYLRNSKILIFVYDVSDPKSINMIDSYLKYLDNLDDFQIIVVGNKTDLMTETELSDIDYQIREKFKQFEIANRISEYVQISSKTGFNFDILMDKLYQCGEKIKETDVSFNQTIKLDEEKINRNFCPC